MIKLRIVSSMLHVKQATFTRGGIKSVDVDSIC